VTFWRASLPAALLLSALLTPVEPAAAEVPCTAAAKAGLKVVDAAGGGALYATHELTVVPLGTGSETSLGTATTSAPGARRLDEAQEGSVPTFVRDSAGPLTVRAVVTTTDPSRPAEDGSCTALVATTVSLLPPRSPLITFKRPRRGKDGRGHVIYPDPPTFTIKVRHSAGTNRLPITVRARVTKRLRLPTGRARAFSHVYAQRASDFVEEPDQRGCASLICPPRTKRGFSKATEVVVFPRGSKTVFSAGLDVKLIPPTGYPAPFRRGKPSREIPTPFGADIELLQGGRPIGRLRVAAKCAGLGQSSRCRFRKVSTKH
jgi:hypothetical protein